MDSPLSDELVDRAEAVARVRGASVNALIVESLASEIERVHADEEFTERARQLLERDKALLDRLARCLGTSPSRSASGSPSRSRVWQPDPPDVDEGEAAMLAIAVNDVDEAWVERWLRERVRFP